MPIRPENAPLYPACWPVFSYCIRADRAKWRCEAEGCDARQGAAHPVTGSTVVLTVAHLDHDPPNISPRNLRAWCQRCHNTYDAPHRRRHRRERLDRVNRQGRLFGA